MFSGVLSKAPDYFWGAISLSKAAVRYKLLRMASTHSKPTVEKHSDAFTVTILPALDDNFMYLITDNTTKEAAIVDPADPDRVKAEVDEQGSLLKSVLTTHHHWDHAGGNNRLVSLFPDVQVIAGDERVDAVNHLVKDGDTLKIGNTNVKCLFTPCHTSGHICYFVTGPNGGSPAVFTGDTLFLSGCGKFFEGTAEEMYENLSNKLGKLPDETKVYCGHEYSIQNLKFALSLDPDNGFLQQKAAYAKKRRDEQLPVPPSTIAEEKAYNPFMRVMNAQEMGEMREKKNSFK